MVSRFENNIDNPGQPTPHCAYDMGWGFAKAGSIDLFKMTVWGQSRASIRLDH